MISKVIEAIVKERPVGTIANNEIIDLLENKFKEMNYFTQSLPFDCFVWKKGKSMLVIDNHLFYVEPSPFSEPFDGVGKLCIVKTLEELLAVDCFDCILVMGGELTKTPLQPKEYPFYYPNEHRKLISLLENKKPKAIIAATGKNTLSGQNPFPIFEDGNFIIPSANISEEILAKIDALKHSKTMAKLIIDSCKTSAKSRQIVASKKPINSIGKIIIGAHMDTKYDTPGALDNGTGVAVLIQVAEALKAAKYDIDLVPFNSEEFYGAYGELEYLKLIDREKDNITLMINIDSPCHNGAKTAISFHNLNETMSEAVNSFVDRSEKVTKGQKWYAGDHVPFILRDIPCIVITSSDLFNGALKYTHTPKDTLETVDLDMVNYTVRCIVEIVSAFSVG